jgi:glycine betaine/proline transport system ATP-binding protein
MARHNGNPSPEAASKEGYITAVRDASVAVYPGEILIIMGLSGSGKSTLVRCLSRLINSTAGELFFEGQDLLTMSDKDLIEIRRHKMGMVFQHFALLPHRTVLQNVAFPLEVQGIDRRERETKAQEMIDLVGLTGREAYYPRELSGGQQQRVGIARSLAVGPELWFLDEPFSALDPLIRREMQDEFLRLQNMLHKTIVFITHDFDEAIRLADRIAIMKDGVIEQLGTAEEIVTKPATDYVREFTKDISRERLLRVKSVMVKGSSVENGAGSVPANAYIAEVAELVLRSEGPIPVHDDNGQTVGVVTRDHVIDALYGESE